MPHIIRLATLLVAMLLALPATSVAEDGEFTPLFNGRDLSGWVNVNTAPSTWRWSTSWSPCWRPGRARPCCGR